MRHRLVIAASVAALLAAAAAHAQLQDPGTDPCATDPDLARCWTREARQANDRMQAAYEALLAKLSKDAAGQLRRSQKAWKEYRDGHLAMLSVAGRSQRARRPPHEVLVCVEIARWDLTLRRFRELRHLLHPEPDDACPLL